MRQLVNTADVVDVVINAVDPDGSATVNEIVAAPTDGKAIRVLNYVLTVPTGAVIQWKSGTTAKSGPMTLSTGVSSASGPGGKLFQCAANQALNLVTDLAGTYGGHMTIQRVEPT